MARKASAPKVRPKNAALIDVLVDATWDDFIKTLQANPTQNCPQEAPPSSDQTIPLKTLATTSARAPNRVPTPLVGKSKKQKGSKPLER